MNLKLTLIAAMVATLALSACGGGGSSNSTPPPATTVPDAPALVKTDIVIGTGGEAVVGKGAAVHYTGYLYSPTAANNKGTQFDSSVGKSPLVVTLGSGGVIAGFDQGIQGMKVGGKRTVQIPSSLGYGARGSGSAIPPNAGLVFDIELVQVQP